jgi:hypothetical protein
MPTQRLQFTEWLPDQPAIGQGLQDAKNVVPVLAGYAPFPSASNFSNAASESINNVFVGKIGDTVQLFGGGASKLFKFDATNLAMTDVSKTGGYSGITRWQYTQFGSILIATNYSAPLQTWTLGVSSTWQDLGTYINGTYTRTLTVVTVTTSTAHGLTTGNTYKIYFKTGGALSGNYVITSTGSTTFTLTTAASGTIASSNMSVYTSSAPTAKYVTVVRDFVVAANILDTPNKLQWSDIANEQNWTSGNASQSDFQLIADGGNITGITGGEIGIIFLEKAIYRMSYIGSPYFFQFDAISRNLGCIEGNSVAQYGGVSYFLSDDGFYSCDGHTVTPIGVEKIDRYFYSTFNLAKSDTMSATIDPIRKLVIWNYPTVTGGNALIIYNWQLQKWTRAETDTNYVASAATTGTTLEGIGTLYTNIETVPASFDDRIWAGGKYVLAGVRGGYIVTFTGSNTTANIILSDFENGYNSVVKLARPIIDNGAGTVAIASRRELDDNITFTTAVASGEGNRVPLRSAGRWHRLSITPTGNWTTAIGVDVDTETQGGR